jgi:hypothetical protein
MFTEAIESMTAEGAANNAAKGNSKVPKFKEFIDVVNAFAGGLIPVACANRPDRAGDYVSFLTEILIQHSTGKQHWPVLLHYIESIRRLKQPSGEGPEMDRIRDAHKLCSYAPPSSRFSSVLDMGQLLLSSSIFNDPSLRSTLQTLQQDFVDHSVLQTIFKTTLPEVDRVNKLFSGTSSLSSLTGGGRAPPAQLPKIPQEDFKFAIRNNVCIKFVQGACDDICPQGRLHEDLSTVRSRIKTQNSTNQEKKGKV